MSTFYHVLSLPQHLYPLLLGTVALYNNSKLLLQDTLITDPQQIPNGLTCVTSRSGGSVKFGIGSNKKPVPSRSGQNTTIQSSQLNKNGLYICYDVGEDRNFHIYFDNGEI